MVEALTEADRELLNSAFKQAKERQAMTQRTIDETGKDVPQHKPRKVIEVLFLRPCAVMGWVPEWVLWTRVCPDGWVCTERMRTRNILDNES